MVVFLMQVTPLSHQRREILEVLRCIIGPTSAKADCLACEVYEGLGDDPPVLYLERWKSKEAIHNHILSPLFSRILAAMDMSAIQPIVQFYEVSQTWGLDLVEQFRGAEGEG